MNIKNIINKKNFIFILICSFILITKTFFIYMANIPTGSMENTFPISSNVIGNRLAYLNENPKRGDIIIFKYSFENIDYVKRIIGLPGEKIEIKDAKIYINDEILKEDYLKEEWVVDNSDFSFVVPDNNYFVLGDNRNNSFDSRYWADTANELNLNNPKQYSFVSQNKIKAKVILMYKPKLQLF